MKWRYLFVVDSIENMPCKLNDRGREQWELVTVLNVSSDEDCRNLRAVLRKPNEEKK